MVNDNLSLFFYLMYWFSIRLFLNLTTIRWITDVGTILLWLIWVVFNFFYCIHFNLSTLSWLLFLLIPQWLSFLFLLLFLYLCLFLWLLPIVLLFWWNKLFRWFLVALCISLFNWRYLKRIILLCIHVDQKWVFNFSSFVVINISLIILIAFN